MAARVHFEKKKRRTGTGGCSCLFIRRRHECDGFVTNYNVAAASVAVVGHDRGRRAPSVDGATPLMARLDGDSVAANSRYGHCDILHLLIRTKFRTKVL